MPVASPPHGEGEAVTRWLCCLLGFLGLRKLQADETPEGGRPFKPCGEVGVGIGGMRQRLDLLTLDRSTFQVGHQQLDRREASPAVWISASVFGNDCSTQGMLESHDDTIRWEFFGEGINKIRLGRG